MRVDGGLVRLLGLVEAEAVVPAVFGTIQLLQEKHHGVVQDAEHPEPVNS